MDVPLGMKDLPALNAVLNGTAAVLLLRGYVLIRAYHARVGAVYFQKTGFLRAVYLTILFTHTVLAAAVPVLAIVTLRRARKAEKTGKFYAHQRIARWTLPIWLYVSVTGVVVYLMLYWL